jgi:DNA-binding response OmpR family regulator
MGSRWILVVEDEPAIAELLVEVLMRSGYLVQHAANGMQAWDLLRISSPPDLVLTDVMMPELDGTALMARMRATRELVQIPVLVLSALDKEEVRNRLPSAEAFLPKPFQIGQLIENVDSLLRQKESDPRC